MAARLVSCLLWAAGSVLLAYLVIRASGSLMLGAAAGILATANPAAWAIGSYVTPHSAALLIGAVLVALHLWVAGPRLRPGWSLAVAGGAGGLIGLTLPHAVVAVAAIALGMVVSALHRRPRPLHLVGASAVLVATNLATSFGWTWLVAARTVGTPAAQPTTPPEGLLAAVRDNWDLFFPRFVSEVPFTSPIQNQAAHLLGYLLVGFLGYWLLVNRMPVQRAITFGIVAAAPMAGAAMALRLDYPVPARYGASLLALVLFLLAIRKRPIWLGWVLLVLAASLAFVTWEGTDSYLYMVE